MIIKTSNSKEKHHTYNLKELDGVRFRVMWSTKILYLYLGILAFVIVISEIYHLLDHESLAISCDEVISSLMWLPLLLILICLNKMFLGSIVAVINEDGIYTKDEHISWKEIKEIGYYVRIPLSRGRSSIYDRYCFLAIYTDYQEYKILHAPRKMVKYIKRYVPDVQVRKDIEAIVMAVIFLGIAILVPAAKKFEWFNW